jgi:phosphoglycolate phosphatase
MIKALLLDLDGTLLDTLDDIADSANYVLEQHGWPIHETMAYKYFIGNGAATLAKRILPEEERTKEQIENVKKLFIDRYQTHVIDKTLPYDGVVEALNESRKRGIRMAVVSNKPDAQTQYVVSKLFEPTLFDYVVGNKPDLPLKPDPTIAKLAMEALGVKPSECLFVGDTGGDMETAKTAGCIAVGVTWGFRERNELLENGADYVIDKPGELIGLL